MRMDAALTAAANQYADMAQQLNDPDIANNIDLVIAYGKKMTELEPLVSLHKQIQDAQAAIAEADDILASHEDKEMHDMAQQQRDDATMTLDDLYEQAKIALLPKDPNDEKNIFLEVRPGAGGDESGLFAAELMRAYLKYADSQGRKSDIIDEQLNEKGGLKFGIMKVSGTRVYSQMKFESGVHRVQRIPETESQGRVHTSTVTVAIMPEADEVDVTLDENDVVMDTFGASSAGGQNANKNQNGVRLHHTPTGIIVTISDTKSQLQNKEKAYTILKTKLYQMELEKQQAADRELRGSQIGSGDRSEKIRTYNFPQDRVTDHRIKQSWSNLPGIMEGNFGDILHQLHIAHQTHLLQNASHDTADPLT